MNLDSQDKMDVHRKELTPEEMEIWNARREASAEYYRNQLFTETTKLLQQLEKTEE